MVWKMQKISAWIWQGGMGEKSAVLSPEEIKAVENLSSLLSLEEVETIARNFEPLELNQDFKVRYSSLEKAYQQKDTYLWNLSFANESKSKDENSRYASITFKCSNRRN